MRSYTVTITPDDRPPADEPWPEHEKPDNGRREVRRSPGEIGFTEQEGWSEERQGRQIAAAGIAQHLRLLVHRPEDEHRRCERECGKTPAPIEKHRCRHDRHKDDRARHEHPRGVMQQRA